MSKTKRSVLITGRSDGGMGAELAKDIHKRGLHVYATARDPAKMASLVALGIETLPLDITSSTSIEECVRKVAHLDILINNAGALYTMPISDMSIDEGKKTFDLNVWGQIAVTQAFLPRLLESKNSPLIVNHTSTGADLCIPFQSVYNASKAAMAMSSATLRLELQPFNIAVVNLKTGGVKTNIINNVVAKNPQIPENSIYAPAKEEMQSALRGEWLGDRGMSVEQWSREVATDLLKRSPPPVIWRGESAWAVWMGTLLPFGSFDGFVKKLTGLNKMEAIIRGKS